MHPALLRKLATIFLVLSCHCRAASGATDANWPQYRGPQASGLGAGKATPIRWDVKTGENILWQADVPGLSHAAPIVWGGRVYVATAARPGKADLKVGLYGDIGSANDQEPHEWRLLAFDQHTGKLAWNQLTHSGIPRVKRHTKASHCNSTPATDGQRIVAILGSEGLFCFDMEGRRQWHVNLGPMNSGYFRSISAQWGFASSPVIHDGKVVVLCDVQTNSFLTLFDLIDGKEIWRTPRRDVPTWSTPTVVKAGQQLQVLVNGWHHTGAYDFATGKEVWKLDGGGDIPVPTPVIAHGFAYFTSAHGQFRPMRAIRLEAKGVITPAEVGATNASIAWVHARQGSYMQTPIVVGEHIYGCLDNGILTCFDAKTGAIQYSERLGSGAEGFTASPVSDGRHLYFASEVGNVLVVLANGKFSVIATNTLGETCMATPAASDGTLFFRTRERLIAVRSK